MPTMASRKKPAVLRSVSVSSAMRTRRADLVSFLAGMMGHFCRVAAGRARLTLRCAHVHVAVEVLERTGDGDAETWRSHWRGDLRVKSERSFVWRSCLSMVQGTEG